MSEGFVFIPGSYGKAVAEHIREVRRNDFVKTAEIVEGILRRFFENAVNTRWARICSPGWFGRKVVDRAGSDSLFFTIYKREGGYDSWPMWTIHWMGAYCDEVQRRNYRDDIFKRYISMFESGLDVYLPEKFFSGILRIDKFFGDSPPEQKSFPNSTSS